MAKAKKSKAKKAKKAPKKAPVKKAAKKTVKKKAARAKPAVKKAAKKSTKKPAPKKKQKLVGEGDYAASRKFLKDQAGFVKRNKKDIPALGRQAQQALDGPEGDELRAAERAGLDRSNPS